MMNFKYTSNPITQNDLDDIEKRLGFKFPAELRELYLQFNGGRPERDKFVGKVGTFIVNAFLPVKYSNSHLDTIETSFQDLNIHKQLLPNFLVPFAIDPFGNYYCFSTQEQDTGAIYFVDMERHGDSSSIAECLSPSFGAFLSNLTAKA